MALLALLVILMVLEQFSDVADGWSCMRLFFE